MPSAIAMRPFLGVPAIAAANAQTPRRVQRGKLSMRVRMRLHELLMGRQTFSIVRQLARTESWSLDQLEGLQKSKLRRLLQSAIDHCPYYQQAPYAGLRIDRLRDIAELPLVTREQLREHAYEMSWRHPRHKKLLDWTRGSTDSPLAYYWDRRRQAWDKAHRLRGLRWQGLTPEDRELHLWPIDPPRSWRERIKQSLRHRRDTFVGEMHIDALHALREHTVNTWRKWHRFDPACVTAYPSLLAELIDAAEGWSGKRANPSLHAICLTGEVALPWQRDLIRRELRVPMMEIYGVQEAGVLAFTCERGSWHIAAESALVEFIHEGRPAKEGELAEIVVTGLESRTMPLIRYCTGDVVRLETKHCSCRRGLPVMPPVLGRCGDFLRTSDERWFDPAMVVQSLNPVLLPGTFQIVQATTGEIEVGVLSSFHRPGIRENVVSCLSKLFGYAPACFVRRIDRLARTEFGKCSYVRSEFALRGLAQTNNQRSITYVQHPILSRRSTPAGFQRRQLAAG